MEDTRKKSIEDGVTRKKGKIKEVDEAFMGEVIGVSQAIGALKKALKKVSKCLDQREFQKASTLGYQDVSSEFVFLQRCLGGLNDTIMQKEKIVSDICLELSKELEGVHYEEVSPLVDQEIDSLKPITKPKKIEILIGDKTAEKLLDLQKIRNTPIEHLAEAILASVMKNDEQTWKEWENENPPIPNIKQEKKESYTGDEVSVHIKALGEQWEERHKNLY